MSAPGLVVAMMVRNEQHRVGRALKSVRPVADRWLVMDTGSTDGTIAEVESATADWAGKLVREPWTDFGANRTRLVQLGREMGAQWLLMLDADHELTDHHHLARTLATTKADALQLPFARLPLQWVSKLIRCGRQWSYVGATHEYLDSDGPFRVQRCRAPRIVDHADGASRTTKFQRDLDILLPQVIEQPADARSWFYLGETYRGLRQPHQAIVSYLRCADLTATVEHGYVSLLYAGCLYAALGHVNQAIPLLEEANTLRPNRREALLRLCQIHNDRGDYDQVLTLLAGTVVRPIPTSDTEGIYPAAYDFQMKQQKRRAIRRT